MSPASVLFESDLVDPTYEVDPDGTIRVPSQPGVGFDVRVDRIDARTVQRATVAV
jgi:L-alanine-DL-glutamate epimerase-like enolase superfamily enzyme